jgi:NADH:ubiquinone oxidoreductase subunit C
MPPDYTSFPLRKDFHLADDAARGSGEGVRHMEQMRSPVAATASNTRRRAKVD